MDNSLAELRKVEQRLQQFTFISEQMNEGVALTDLNGLVKYINTPMAKMHGYVSTEDLAGKNISIFHTEEQMNTDILAMIEEAKQRGGLSGPVEHLRRDGTLFPTRTKISLLKDGGEEPIGLGVFVTDETERIQSAESLNNRIAELQEYNGKLKKEICEHKVFESSLVTQASEIIAAKENIQRQVAEREREIEQLRQQLVERDADSSELTEQLNQQINEYQRFEELARGNRDKLQQYIGERTAELAVVNEQSQFSDSPAEQPEHI